MRGFGDKVRTLIMALRVRSGLLRHLRTIGNHDAGYERPVRKFCV